MLQEDILTIEEARKGEDIGRAIFEILSKDDLLFGMYYLSEHFRIIPPPGFHVKIVKESRANRFLAIQAPRESAKSTLLTLLRPISDICYKRKRFIVILQNTEMKAGGSLDSIKREFSVNENLVNSFGVELERSTSNDSIFVHRDGFRTRVLCRGVEQIGSIRGEKFGAWRPDDFIVDDLEDDELVKNPDRRRELKLLYDEALIPAGEYGKFSIVVIGTILHQGSLLSRLVSKDEYKEYRKLFYIALYKGRDGKEYSLWPEKWSVEDLKKIRDNNPLTFAKEYQGDPTSGAMRKFNLEDFRRWTISGSEYICFDDKNIIIYKGQISDCKAAISCDLAWEEKRSHDDSVIMPGLLTPENNILIDDYICEKGLRPDRMEEILFNMEEKYRNMTGDIVPIGFEKAKLEKVAKWFLKRAMRKRNKFLVMKNLVWGGDKIERIFTKLQPRYKMHSIFHRSGMGKLEQQLFHFPGTHDDLPDAAQGLCQLLSVPKVKKKPVKEQNSFMKIRDFAIKSRFPSMKKPPSYPLGYKKRSFSIPATISILD